MSRVAFLIDGFNLYHALDYSPDQRGIADPHRYKKYKWLNLRMLCEFYASIVHGDTVESIHCFTALAHWNPQKVSRHQLYLKALRNEGVEVVFGEFKRKMKHCNVCRRDFPSYEEKQTDVNIAVTLFQLAVEDRFDKAILISGDTDVLPAVRLVQKTYPAKKVGVVIPIARASEAFKRVADFHYKMTEAHLQRSQFPDPYELSNGATIAKPATWV